MVNWYWCLIWLVLNSSCRRPVTLDQLEVLNSCHPQGDPPSWIYPVNWRVHFVEEEGGRRGMLMFLGIIWFSKSLESLKIHKLKNKHRKLNTPAAHIFLLPAAQQLLWPTFVLIIVLGKGKGLGWVASLFYPLYFCYKAVCLSVVWTTLGWWNMALVWLELLIFHFIVALGVCALLFYYIV